MLDYFKSQPLQTYAVGRQSREFLEGMRDLGIGDNLIAPVEFHYLRLCSQLYGRIFSPKSDHDHLRPIAIFVHENTPPSCHVSVVGDFPNALKFILTHRSPTSIENNPILPHTINMEDIAVRGQELVAELNPLIDLFLTVSWRIYLEQFRRYGYNPDEE